MHVMMLNMRLSGAAMLAVQAEAVQPALILP